MRLVAAAILSMALLPLEASAQSRVVEVRAAGGSDVTRAMAQSIRSFEARLGIEVRWDDREHIDAREVLAEREPESSQSESSQSERSQSERSQSESSQSESSESEVLARVWLDLGDPERAVLFIANASNDRFLVRVVPIADHYGEMSRESLATIVESVIDALLAGGEIGVDRQAAAREIDAQVEPVAQIEAPVVVEPPPPPLPEPPEAPTPPPPGRFVAVPALRYRVDAIADGPVARHGPELAFSWTGLVEPTFGAFFTVSARYDLPYSLGDPSRAVDIQGGGARGSVGATGRIGDFFVWQLAAGGGIDIANVEPRFAADTGLTGASPFTLLVPILTAYASAALRPAPWIELSFAIGLDVDLAGHHFDLQSGPTRTVLVDPWIVHPFGLVGIGLPLEV